jgi:uncharacterized membrane protein
MKKSLKVKRIAACGILCALEVVLSIVSIYVKILPFSINLALIPIIIGACVYGPFVGLFLGIVNGCLNLLDASFFLAYNVPLTILLCLVKTGVAGLVAGYVYKLLRKFNFLVAIIVATLITPTVNSGIFVVGTYFIFGQLFAEYAASEGISLMRYIIVNLVLVNYVIELVIDIVLTPAVYTIIRVFAKKYDIGSYYISEKIEA